MSATALTNPPENFAMRDEKVRHSEEAVPVKNAFTKQLAPAGESFSDRGRVVLSMVLRNVPRGTAYF